MPFKSKAQVGKMAILEKEGKVKKGTFKEFAEATPSIKALPNKVKKRSNSMKKLPEHAKKKAKEIMQDYPENFIDALKHDLVMKYMKCDHEWGQTILLSLPSKIQCKKCYMIKELDK